MKPKTLAVRAGAGVDPRTGALAPPICLSTTFEHAPDYSKIYEGGYGYARDSNPNADALERALAALDGGAAALSFASGMAAGAALLQSLPRGSRVLFHRDLFYEFRRMARRLFPAWGLEAATIDMSDLDAVRSAVSEGVALLWCETPSNPRLETLDISALAEIARAGDAHLLVDGTFTTPALQRPLSLGADYVLHSATKYLGGHSDAVAGALVFAESGDVAERVKTIRTMTGGIIAPFNAWLISRGLKSLHCRLAQQCESAARLAAALEGHEALETVHYPGLSSHPTHDLAARQMRAFGGMASIEVRGGAEAALAVAGRVRLFLNATSLGGAESLVEHRASVEGPDTQAPAGLLRLSIGLEDPGDLIDDLSEALGVSR